MWLSGPDGLHVSNMQSALLISEHYLNNRNKDNWIHENGFLVWTGLPYVRLPLVGMHRIETEALSEWHGSVVELCESTKW